MSLCVILCIAKLSSIWPIIEITDHTSAVDCVIIHSVSVESVDDSSGVKHSILRYEYSWTVSTAVRLSSLVMSVLANTDSKACTIYVPKVDMRTYIQCNFVRSHLHYTVGSLVLCHFHFSNKHHEG